MNKPQTPLYGLILSGGKSTRMGTDKGLIEYHGIPQRDYLYKLLQTVCDDVYMSIRPEQKEGFKAVTNLILDKNEYRGPYNGLLSAHSQFPNAAWLVVACDMPLLDKSALKQLIQERNKTKIATAFATKESELPEPLCAIWEPQALKDSIAYLQAGNGTCPRKFLINSDATLVFPEQDEVLWNANSKEEYKIALERIR